MKVFFPPLWIRSFLRVRERSAGGPEVFQQQFAEFESRSEELRNRLLQQLSVDQFVSDRSDPIRPDRWIRGAAAAEVSDGLRRSLGPDSEVKVRRRRLFRSEAGFWCETEQLSDLWPPNFVWMIRSDGEEVFRYFRRSRFMKRSSWDGDGSAEYRSSIDIWVVLVTRRLMWVSFFLLFPVKHISDRTGGRERVFRSTPNMNVYQTLLWKNQ